MEKISDELYREHILDLYKSPANFGELKNPTHKHTETNSSCGDEITINLVMENEKVRDVKFSGSGCVISLVSASLLTKKIKGMKIQDIQKMDKSDIIKLLKIKVNPARMKCALLSLKAVKSALEKK